MNQNNYPKVDLEFLHSIVKQSEKIESIVEVGGTIAYILKGTGSIRKRTLIFRSPKDLKEVDYEYAMGIAYRIGKISELMIFLERTKNFKEGGYFQ